MRCGAQARKQTYMCVEQSANSERKQNGKERHVSQGTRETTLRCNKIFFRGEGVKEVARNNGAGRWCARSERRKTDIRARASSADSWRVRQAQQINAAHMQAAEKCTGYLRVVAFIFVPAHDAFAKMKTPAADVHDSRARQRKRARALTQLLEGDTRPAQTCYAQNASR